MDVLQSLEPELCGAIVVGAMVCVLASRYWRRKQSYKGTKLNAQSSSSHSREKIIGPDGDQQNPQPCGDHNSPQPQRPDPKFPNAAIQMTASDFKDQQEVLKTSASFACSHKHNVTPHLDQLRFSLPSQSTTHRLTIIVAVTTVPTLQLACTQNAITVDIYITTTRNY